MMFCTNCGNEMPDAATRCLKCGASRGDVGATSGLPSPNPDNYLIAAILLSLCGCTPLGLVALVYAGKGSGLKEAGDIARASEYGRNARLWTWITFGCVVFFWIGYAALVMFGVLANAGNW